VAVRDNPSAATAAGVSLVRIKMMAFVVSAAMAGLAGALFAVQKTVVTRTTSPPISRSSSC
jgi:ABC-type branched-subunit amino acid transport system permease subunit